MYQSTSTNLKSTFKNDRFIPRRMSINFDLDISHNSFSSVEPDVEKESEFLNFAKVRYNHTNYRSSLRNVLMPLNTRILNFFSPKKFRQVPPQPDEAWPVKPRRKPVIGPPSIILDMPHLDSNICHHVADWSSTNCLATIFEKEVHMWYPHSEFLRCRTDTQSRVQNCVKWQGGGTKFAVGLFPNRLGIWDILAKKITSETYCCASFCEVFCLEWIDDNRLVTGCKKGTLRVFNSTLQRLKAVRIFKNAAIINISSSCSKNFIATSSTDKCVTVWKIPEMEGLFQIKVPSVIRALAWHPWKTALLAIGLSSEEGRVIIWNVNNNSQVACEKRTYKNSSVDCLTFNPISGELVVSYFVAPEGGGRKGNGIVSVLGSIDKVVEELHIHNGPIPYLLWGDGGNILASVSADENLCIWDFFGHSSSNADVKGKMKKADESFSRNSQILRTFIR